MSAAGIKRTPHGGAVGCPHCGGMGGYGAPGGYDLWLICPCTRSTFRGFVEAGSGKRCEETPHRFEVCS